MMKLGWKDGWKGKTRKGQRREGWRSEGGEVEEEEEEDAVRKHFSLIKTNVHWVRVIMFREDW